MADTRSRSYAIIEVDHSAEEANAASPTTYCNPCKILFMHNSQEKTQVEFLQIIGRYKQTTGTEKCKYQLDIKSPTVVEVREIYEGWVKTSKSRTKTLLMCEYAFGQALQ